MDHIEGHFERKSPRIEPGAASTGFVAPMS